MARLMGSKSLRKGLLVRNAGEGAVLSSLGYVLFVLCPNDFGYYVSPLLIGLGNGHIWPAFMNMTIHVADNNERGTANSTLLVSWDAGIGLGLLAGGLLSEYIGYSFAFFTVAFFQLAGTALFFLATRHFFLARRRTSTEA